VETGKTRGMKPSPDPHRRHRFPAEIISHAVWLYHVFSLSLRDVELLLAERIHIDRRGAENGKCSGSNRQGRPRTSSPFTHSSMATPIHAAI
jgi:putative transposase